MSEIQEKIGLYISEPTLQQKHLLNKSQQYLLPNFVEVK